jgi:hypothetical protein
VRLLVTLAVVALLAGCGAPATDPGAGATATGDASRRAIASSPPATQQLTGTLGGDAELEGGCVWLDTGQGRVEVLWPEGWTVGTDPVELRDPDGQVVAGAGDEIEVEAAPAPDLVSTCQVGDLWRATAVRAR